MKKKWFWLMSFPARNYPNPVILQNACWSYTILIILNTKVQTDCLVLVTKFAH